MESEPSHRLVDAARAGQPSAQEALIKAYQQRIAGFVYTFTGEANAIEDLTQEIFIKMVQGLHGLKDVGRFEAWLFRLARNACCSHLRKRRWLRNFIPFAEHHDAAAPEAEAEVSPEAAWLRRAIVALPQGQRELLALLQDQAMPYEDLARISGSTVGSVKSRLFRAREQLKQWRQHGF